MEPVHPPPAPDPDASADSETWRWTRATRARLVIDAADYFAVLQRAMRAARQQVVLVGWDFDTRIRLGPGRKWWNLPYPEKFPARLGAFVVWLTQRRPGLEVRVLRWNFGALKFVFRGTMILDLARWWWNRRIVVKFDSAHPVGCSHHQKLVVIDDRLAACGGIDLTTDRWDTPVHAEDDPLRRNPYGTRHYGPWHDLALLVEGETAAALGELARARWERAGGIAYPACAPQKASPWPRALAADFSDVEIGIARTRAAWGGSREVREIEARFVASIARARRLIYFENQYFASRAIAEALAERLAAPDPPEVLLVNPLAASGWLAQAAMDAARVRLAHAVAAEDRAGRFRIMVPRNAAGTPIYVHAKLMIVDDELLQIGSANLNNRSLGLDTECDLVIDAARPGNAHAAPSIGGLRARLLAEHCGLDPGEVARRLGEGMAMRDLAALPSENGKRLEPFVLRALTDTEKAVADTALLDPERPGDLFEPFRRGRGLFGRGGLLHRPG